jgi:hypothetical protein
VALARLNRTALAPNLILDVLRVVLVQAGLCESRSAGEEGIFFAVEGRDEVSLQYVESERRKSTHDLAPSLRAKAAVLKCYSALADSDYVLTLVSSPRTLTLHVRHETQIDRSR